MRVSTAQVFERNTTSILRDQSSVYRTQNQLSTGRRVVTPSDDPVAASKALVVMQNKEVNNYFQTNQTDATQRLSLLESRLGDVADVLQSVRSSIVEAGNGTYTASDRKTVANNLRQMFDQLGSLANSADAQGNYLFAGNKTNSSPYPNASNGNIAASTTYAYQGDNGVQKLQVDGSRQMDVSVTGEDVFGRVSNAAGGQQDIFKVMNDLIVDLENNVTTNLGSANANVQNALNTALRARTDSGAKLAELENLSSLSAAEDLNYQSNISDLVDLDYASALTTLSRQQLVLEAAQKSFANTSSLSLFKYI